MLQKAKTFYELWMMDKSPDMFDMLAQGFTAEIFCNHETASYNKEIFQRSITEKHINNAIDIIHNAPPVFIAIDDMKVRITTDTNQTRLGLGIDELDGRCSQYHVKGYVELTFDDNLEISALKTEYSKTLLPPELSEIKSYTPNFEREEVQEPASPSPEVSEKRNLSFTP